MFNIFYFQRLWGGGGGAATSKGAIGAREWILKILEISLHIRVYICMKQDVSGNSCVIIHEFIISKAIPTLFLLFCGVLRVTKCPGSDRLNSSFYSHGPFVRNFAVRGFTRISSSSRIVLLFLPSLGCGLGFFLRPLFAYHRRQPLSRRKDVVSS